MRNAPLDSLLQASLEVSCRPCVTMTTHVHVKHLFVLRRYHNVFPSLPPSPSLLPSLPPSLSLSPSLSPSLPPSLSPFLPPSLPPSFPRLQLLATVELHVVLQFLPVLLTQLFRLLCTSSKDMEQLKAEVVR